MSKQERPRVSGGTIKTAKRLLGYVTGTYKVQFIIVLFCILISSIASISVSLSLRFLLDDYIIPLIGQQDPDYSELYMALTVLGTIFLCGARDRSYDPYIKDCYRKQRKILYPAAA